MSAQSRILAGQSHRYCTCSSYGDTHGCSMCVSLYVGAVCVVAIVCPKLQVFTDMALSGSVTCILVEILSNCIT